jgi:hypothetical protein
LSRPPSTESLAEQGEGPILVVLGAGDQPETPKREGLPARALRFLGDRERAREPLGGAVEIVLGEAGVAGLQERPWQNREQTLTLGSRDRRVGERHAFLAVAEADEDTRERAHRVRGPAEGRQRLAELSLGRGVLAAVRMADGEHRFRPACLPGVADVLGKAPRPSKRRFGRTVAALDRGDPASLAFDLRRGRAVAEVVRKVQGSLEKARRLARRA